MENKIQELLKNAISEALRQSGFEGDHSGEIILDLPDDSRFGDLTTNIALRLSKLAKKPPAQIAREVVQKIKEILEASPTGPQVSDIRVEGAGFINFYLKDSYFYSYLKDVVAGKEGALRPGFGNRKRVLIEFVSANPTGSLSVAHARQAAVGDSLANILNFLGFEARKEYYLNDEGNQINILGASVELRAKELKGEKVEFPENYYQGDYIYDIARALEAEKTRPEDPGDYAAKYILDIIKKELSDFGVNFDFWTSQKELRKSGKIESALEFLKGKGLLYEEEGALWFKSTEFGDDKDRVVIKSDKSYTYLAPDIAYHRDKYERGFQWLINLWGPDHHGYISRLKAAVEGLGHDPDSLSVIIVQLATIFRAGKQVHMSTRKGQYITLREVLDEVGRDAARFFFIMRRTASHLDFDLEVAKKQTSENPVYYVQYAYARIASILRNTPEKTLSEEADLSLLREEEEIALIKKLWQFSFILNICIMTQDPYMLTVYLQEASESFHKFYDAHRVLGQDEKLTQARLALIEGVRVVISASLDLLGISRPEKM